MIFRFGDFELDTGVPELRHDGQAVPLEPQVFELLRFLIENRDRAVTKQEIFDEVWDGRIVSESALSSRIKAARQALGDSGKSQTFIQTYHGRGFRFVGNGEEVEQSAPRKSSLPGTITLPDRPSIAVMPFANLSGESDQDYFSHGIAADVSAMLARNRSLLVIGVNSTSGYRQESADVRAIGKEFHVRYVAEGNVRKSRDKVRISAQLVQTENGATLWSQHYDRELTDVFDVQDDIAQRIAATVEPELNAAEANKVRSKPPESMTAWESYQRGVSLLYSFAIENINKAKDRFEHAINLDTHFSAAYARLAYVYIQLFWYGVHSERQENLSKAEEFAKKSIALDEREALGHFALGRAIALQGNWDEGIIKLHDAIKLNPGHAQPYFGLGHALLYSSNATDALEYLEIAIRLSPHDPHKWTFLHIQALAYYKLGEMEQALQSSIAATHQANATHWPYATHTSILGNVGSASAAKLATTKLLQLRPDYSCSLARQDSEFDSDAQFVDLFVEGLRKAGLPD